MRIPSAAIVLAVAMAAGAPCHAAPAAAAHLFPDVFLKDLYAHYKQDDFCPTCEADRYFDAGLAALLKKDSELADGEVGSFDGDPICQCQDPDGMKAKVLTISQTGRGAVAADVALQFPSETRHVTIDLILENGQWRIHDTHSKDTPSLRKLLEDGVAAMSK